MKLYELELFVNNETVLTTPFRVKGNELNFNKTIQVAPETREADKVTIKTVHKNLAKVNKIA